MPQLVDYFIKAKEKFEVRIASHARLTGVNIDTLLSNRQRFCDARSKPPGAAIRIF
jgi:hypothetical protein